MKSDLSVYFSTKVCPNSNPRTEPITKITIHHMAAVTTAKACAASFYNPHRQGSANYCVDGKEIICCIPEERRAWTSGSKWNDQRAITIEVANSTGKPKWEISDAAYRNLIRLCIDICKRYHITPTFNNTKNASFTFHYMFQSTECPGPWIKSHTKQIIEDVKAGLKGEAIPDTEPEPAPVPKPETKNLIKVTVPALNIRSGPGTKYPVVGCITDHGIYTIIEKKSGWGKLKSGKGWIYLKYTKGV